MTKVAIVVMGVALAAVGVRAAGAADVLYGCSNNATGRVRRLQVNTPPACSSTETLRTWDPGAQAERGFTECHVENFGASCDANTFAVLDRSCAAGFATGASAIWMSPSGGADNGTFYFWARSGNLWTTIPWFRMLYLYSTAIVAACKATLLPSAILIAKAWPRLRLAKACTPSAPTLVTQSPRPARM